MAYVVPSADDFVISQGDSLPVMRIPVFPLSTGELLDLDGCTVTFLGRVENTRTYPPPIVRPIESYATETEDGTPVVAVYVHLTDADTKSVSVPTGQNYVKMSGELEVVDADGEIVTVYLYADAGAGDPPYIPWYIRDDIGDGA